MVKAATFTAQTLSKLMGIPEGGAMSKDDFTGLFQWLWYTLILVSHTNTKMADDRRSKLTRNLFKVDSIALARYIEHGR